MAEPDDLQARTLQLLRELIRLDTVNPPGGERPAVALLRERCESAGFDCVTLAEDPERPNLVATLGDPRDGGPVLGLLGHVDTVLADAEAWSHDPWGAELVDGLLYGRGAIDMKNQVAAQVAAATDLAAAGWRPRHGALRLICVSDEETGGAHGARWLCAEHPDAVRCDYLLNEGAGARFQFGGRRHYGVCCAEKGIYRFTLTARGAAAHASLPTVGDNALLRLAPVLTALADPPEGFAVTEAPAALLEGLDLDPGDPSASLRAIRDADPALHALLAPMFGVTLAPTMISASQKINVLPARAQLRVDCRVPPGLGEPAARERVDQVLGLTGDGSETIELRFGEAQPGNGSPVHTPLMDVIADWVAGADPGASAVPMILPGFSDSSWFRAAFPDLVAYGFFPHRHQPYTETMALMHSADERIDVRDLAFATGFYRDAIRALLD